MNEKVTKALFGLGAVGVITAAVILGGGDPEQDGLPTPPPLQANRVGWYHTYHSAEIPSTPPRIVHKHKVTRDRVVAERRRQSGSYVGSNHAVLRVAGNPASQTARIWGNPAPGENSRP